MINWDTLVNTIRAPLNDIDAKWVDLLSGLDSSAQLADYVEVGTDLLQINQADCPRRRGPHQSRASFRSRRDAAPDCRARAASRGGSALGSPAASSPPMTPYSAISTTYLGEQLRAITIVVNAVIFQKADPTTWITSFTGYIKAECAAFLSAVEQLVVSYCGDLTVLGLMTGPNIATNPLGAINPIGAAATPTSRPVSHPPIISSSGFGTAREAEIFPSRRALPSSARTRPRSRSWLRPAPRPRRSPATRPCH